MKMGHVMTSVYIIGFIIPEDIWDESCIISLRSSFIFSTRWRLPEAWASLNSALNRFWRSPRGISASSAARAVSLSGPSIRSFTPSGRGAAADRKLRA